MNSSSLADYINSLTTLDGYYATWDYPRDSCAYTGSISLIPSRQSTPLPPLEHTLRQFAVNLENGHRVFWTLVRLLQLDAPLALFQKYNIRKLAGQYLYNFETMDPVVKLAEKIEEMQSEEQKSRPSSVSSPVSSSSSSSSEFDNVFQNGSIDVSSTLDRLIGYVKRRESI